MLVTGDFNWEGEDTGSLKKEFWRFLVSHAEYFLVLTTQILSSKMSWPSTHTSYSVCSY